MKSFLTMFAFAKINLGLAVVGKRDDGYHDIQSVLQSIELHDLVHVELTDPKHGIVCECGPLSGINNLAYKAAELFIKHLDPAKRTGVHINIEKKIPWEAGLAGGSSDAAAVLKALNHLYNEPFLKNELMQLAAMIGADVAFCLHGGTMWAEGRGEILEPMPSAPLLDLVIVKPKRGVSTKEAYARFYKAGKYGRLPKADWENALNSKDIGQLFKLMRNDLEQSSLEIVPEILKIKQALLEQGCLKSLMCGSGSAVFGVARDAKHAQDICQHFINLGYEQVWATHTVN